MKKLKDMTPFERELELNFKELNRDIEEVIHAKDEDNRRALKLAMKYITIKSCLDCKYYPTPCVYENREKECEGCSSKNVLDELLFILEESSEDEMDEL